MTNDAAPKHTFLVTHDYGMGGLWWWIRARSEREILETFAWVEVVTDPEAVARYRNSALDEVDIDAPEMPVGLRELRAERDGQRGRPGFGALSGRHVVHLRQSGEEDDSDWLVEVGADGRRLRQVELPASGPAVRSTPGDWALNPPVADLFAPETAADEISAAEFEKHWARARQFEE